MRSFLGPSPSGRSPVQPHGDPLPTRTPANTAECNHGGGPQASEATCASCHGANGPNAVAKVHALNGIPPE